MGWDIYNDASLLDQANRQKAETWSLGDLPWSQGIDLKKPFLPLDEQSIACPGATPVQKKVLSQFMGLVVNATIAEMELVAHKWKEVAWRQVLNRYPVNPEMRDLGEQFFEEEKKHADAFVKYISVFCETSGMKPESLRRLLPHVPGTLTEKLLSQNAKSGGHAFWWIVSVVEEASIEIYRMIHPMRDQLDPLYYAIHRKHTEDEVRHKNYAFLMLELLNQYNSGLRGYFHKKTDLVFAQMLTGIWAVANAEKIFESKKMREEHEFFDTLATCCVLIKSQNWIKTLWNLVEGAPYISLLINTKFHKHTMNLAREQGAFRLPFPGPRPKKLVPSAMDS